MQGLTSQIIKIRTAPSAPASIMNGKQTAGVAVGVLTGSLAGFLLGR